VLLIALGATGLQVNAWSNQLETISYAMIALVGLYLLSAQLRSVWRRWQRNRPVIEVRDGHGRSDHHHHDAHHSHHRHGYGDHHHEDRHHHAPGEACDHMVDARQLAGPVSWRKMMAVVFSVGIRPCTGAILVLVFALTQGLFWAGVAATFAMAVGTAITVAMLATLAVGSRELALKLGGTNSTWTNMVWSTCAIGGATIILLFGVLMFTASLGPARPF
jgi:ABC-type nickel/cobalt efflux system permease component RcnA